MVSSKGNGAYAKVAIVGCSVKLVVVGAREDLNRIDEEKCLYSTITIS